MPKKDSTKTKVVKPVKKSTKSVAKKKPADPNALIKTIFGLNH